MTAEPINPARRGFLNCMTWAGSAMLWTVAGGVPRSRLIGQAEAAETGFTFAQVSDSHLGFDKPVNANVTGTFQEALDRVTGMAEKPAFLIHTGDITHLSTPEQFDTGARLLGATKLQTYTVPGEHDILEEDRKSYLNRYGKGTHGDGWYSFDAHGVHFIGLVNVVNLQGAGLGQLGRPQLEWLEKDVRPLSASTPIVVFAHVPLWIVYQDWGWGTSDGAQALLLEAVRFGNGIERPHSSGDAENRGARRVSHRPLHRVSARRSGRRQSTWTDAGAAGRAEDLPRHGEGHAGDGEIPARHRRYAAGRLTGGNQCPNI